MLGPVVVGQFGGSIVLTGTPNAACAGPFHDIVVGKQPGWSVHGWTMFDNPHLPNIASYVDDMLHRRGWTREHPGFRREFLGEWVRDAEGLVFRLDEARNVIEEADLSGDEWDYVLGIDLGFNDPSAFVVLAYSPERAKCIVVDSWKESDLIPSAVAAKVEALRERWPIGRIVADSGGYGKGIVEEMKQKFGLPILSARKQDKAAFVELLNGDLRAGVLQIPRSERPLLDEMRLLQWDSRAVERGRLQYDARFADHLCDALLYAWRECRHQGDDGVRDLPKPGTPDWHEAQAKHALALAERQFGEREDRPWWDSMGDDFGGAAD